ncbi:TrmH family RNA methyltransferase [Candidatus Korobacter versatilis]|uniref:TrmH family RNA methyltransferase n=1 Tax=Candidatus Korobacter versatilis TaxID=658062 RepID=UPI000303CC60|nr:RNA methyltransferase [Candidatus Koribacter versatilis]
MDQSPNDRLRLITSRQNNAVKELRAAFHTGRPTDDGYSAVEGVHLLEEAIRSGLRFKTIFFSQAAEDRAGKLLPQIHSNVETLLLPDEVFSSAVLTESPQGVAALVKLKTFKLEDLLRAENPMLLGVAGVQDPGNLGTILRSAEAFGATGVLIGDKTASPWNPKVIRGSSGSVFRLPVVKVEWPAALEQLRAKGVQILATSSHKGEPLPEVDFTGPTIVLIGGEGAGVPRDVLASVDGTLAIPHSPKVESLNAGIAASIVMYEAARQRNTQ